MNDALGLSLSCESAAAAQAYQRAVDAYLHAWPGVGPAVDEALAAAPDFALAHALRALHAAVYMQRAKSHQRLRPRSVARLRPASANARM